ncbi:MAG: hypothetical protein QXT73_07940, partial [Candidatus Methanomethylicaceae archaeon]
DVVYQTAPAKFVDEIHSGGKGRKHAFDETNSCKPRDQGANQTGITAMNALFFPYFCPKIRTCARLTDSMR